MERIRTGLGGLGMVLVLILAGSLFADAAAEPEAAEPSAETLAMLGAAPATADPKRTAVPRRRDTMGTALPLPDSRTI